MKKLTTLTLGVMMVALTACGGNGSGNDNSAKPLIGATGGHHAGNNNSSGISTDQQGIGGNRLTVNFNRATTHKNPTERTDDINHLFINGKSVDVIPQGLIVGAGFAILKDSTSERTVKAGDDMRFGYLKTGTDNTGYLFSQGNLTKNVPTTGQAAYAGNAVHMISNANRTETDISTPTARFEVDFGAKALNGQINADNKVLLSGKINGNQFVGTKDGVAVDGYFYGNNASQLGGVYTNKNGTISGAFGATKKTN